MDTVQTYWNTATVGSALLFPCSLTVCISLLLQLCHHLKLWYLLFCFCSILIIVKFITDCFIFFIILSYTCLSFLQLDFYCIMSSFRVCFSYQCLFIDVLGVWAFFLDVRSLCRSNSKTALNKWFACWVCVCVCDFYD